MFNRDNGKRKWQCFVCGKEYEVFEDFCSHIKESHEEGREYIICPLARCGTPIRDMNLHFKAKHPQDVIPKYHGPSRAIVWKDQKKNKRDKKVDFRKGHFVSAKNNGKEFYYRSGYECEVLECLERIPEVIAYDVEPFKTGIPYLFKGEQHHYFPDLSLQFADGHIEIWEIKPASQTLLEVNNAKWQAANVYCTARDWKFIVITEVGIGKLKSLVRRTANQEL
jgi:TnsA endonuclease N terminal